ATRKLPKLFVGRIEQRRERAGKNGRTGSEEGNLLDIVADAAHHDRVFLPRGGEIVGDFITIAATEREIGERRQQVFLLRVSSLPQHLGELFGKLRFHSETPVDGARAILGTAEQRDPV